MRVPQKLQQYLILLHVVLLFAASHTDDAETVEASSAAAAAAAMGDNGHKERCCAQPGQHPCHSSRWDRPQAVRSRGRLQAPEWHARNMAKNIQNQFLLSPAKTNGIRYCPTSDARSRTEAGSDRPHAQALSIKCCRRWSRGSSGCSRRCTTRAQELEECIP